MYISASKLLRKVLDTFNFCTKVLVNWKCHKKLFSMLMDDNVANRLHQNVKVDYAFSKIVV